MENEQYIPKSNLNVSILYFHQRITPDKIEEQNTTYKLGVKVDVESLECKTFTQYALVRTYMFMLNVLALETFSHLSLHVSGSIKTITVMNYPALFSHSLSFF